MYHCVHYGATDDILVRLGGGLEVQETGARVSDRVLMLCAGQVRSHHREEAGEWRGWGGGGADFCNQDKHPELQQQGVTQQI